MTEGPLSSSLKAIARGEPLPTEMLEQAFDALLSGEAAPEETGALLMGLAVRGETASELVAGARIMRRHARKVTIEGPLLDTCGTGGLPWKSLNTSTASALVIAAAGGRVAKHGNRSVPPKTGSADVLEALGVNLDVDERTLQDCIARAGVGFMFARTHHGAMRHVAPIRTRLGIRTIFNLLGPLTNPAGAQHQVLGVFAPEWVRPMAEALGELGTTRSWVVHGLDGIDEISISGITRVCEVSPAGIREFIVEPAMAGLPSHPLSMLEGVDVQGNAEAILDLFDGHQGPFRDMVVLNAAAGLLVLGLADDLKNGAALAASAIDSGKAREALQRLRRASNGEADE
ncbi:MAG: anthranilate phosphoribosyltransferase [Hyphomonas sp.]|uniref:anthranilate phosphoribosyltransferase n=1 Tax=Hyphomonas sp. TaxID=87 RepID=UPI00183A34C2|nr:anthranilate phosphoribosyltransferase [Hyphomonas sp.]MBA3069682.1 anthranilate phosphoribosyltransferase [Hyphomonas sp.]MBU3920179.1 anthranilate phosphoribosyltransferase [Alphaproteobacteria bacterium]MBU4062523.1 anthranilate phosphoribosyltransferase [Alphaproteobacteria bacterium]MBU4163874.1 anthranilate phosphoribosyltransferase [Alphaproteobacteria bacterium]